MTIPETMNAVAIERFGDATELKLMRMPVPKLGDDDVLIRVEVAGVASWDINERVGEFATMTEIAPVFPYILGSEGAGIVAATGRKVTRFRTGENVYAMCFLNPKGGFYARYAAVPAHLVSHIPGNVDLPRAAVMGGVGITALRGLDDVLHLKTGETLAILGASGGIGHLAVQLAKRMGARVLAIVSSGDGAELVGQLGADLVVNGREQDVAMAARGFAPDGVDALLLTTGGAAAEAALGLLGKTGRAAAPNGVGPLPEAGKHVEVKRYDGGQDADILTRFNALVESGPFHVHIARTFPLDEAQAAQRALESHYLGKLALRVS